ncbi:Terminal nucleotidyltransferase 4B [Erysiphe necator]|nr:Terminal nucleotidyltransferase 4B [Erysiphe necator]
MHQPRHVLQALADFPSTIENVVTSRSLRLPSIIVEKKNNKKLIDRNINSRMSPPLPSMRGPPPTGPSAMKGSAPSGPSAMQHRGARRAPNSNNTNPQLAHHNYLTRSNSDPSIYRENRKSLKTNNTINDTYRASYDFGSQSSRPDRYYPQKLDTHQDQLRRFDHKIHDRGKDDRTFFSHLDKRGPVDEKNNRNQARDRQSTSKAPNRVRRGYGRNSRVASEREFLRTNREPTPQLMTGMNDESGTSVKFHRLEDLSDSEETDMDLSGNEDSNFEKNKPCSLPNSPKGSVKSDIKLAKSTLPNDFQADELNHIGTQSLINEKDDKKKIVKALSEKKNNDRPRWSNPDPYTALPPPDESQKKKKDVVKLIRKARISSGSKTKLETPTDDFISFDFEENNLIDSTDSLDRCHSPPIFRESIHSAEKQDRSRIIRASSPFSRKTRRSASPSDTEKDIVTKVRGKLPIRSSVNEYSGHDFQSESNLGSRKRTINDEIKEPPIAHEKGVRSPPDGRILENWLSYDNISESPWLIDHSNINNIYKRLHEEILDFYHYVKPRRFEKCVREKLIEDLKYRVRNYSKDAEILSFGSFPAGLYLPTADLDLVMISNHYMRGGRPQFGYNSGQVHKFGRFLEEEQIILKGSKECITKAKVPLVKYVDRLTGLKVDISFENTTGLVANKTFQAWKEKFPAMPIIVTLIKQFLFMRGLDQPVNGGIGGFSITCLVVSLLQHMPQVRNKSMVPEHNLGEVLLEFFDLYGNRFNTVKNAISLNPACYLRKCELNHVYQKRIDKFCIIDPNNPENDIAGGSKNSMTIKKSFKIAYENLRNRMIELQKKLDNNQNRPQSILSCIIGGNYNSFKLQREHLEYVYENRFS